MTRILEKPWVWGGIASAVYWGWLSRVRLNDTGSLTWWLAGTAQLSVFTYATTTVATWLTGYQPRNWQQAALVGTLGLAATWGVLRLLYPQHHPCETGIAAYCV